jgi:predicted transposase/invertase (TIGR01784 family)
MLQDKYLNLFTDFGFKRIFGQEQSKETLMAFLNTLLPERHQIHDLQYTNPEHQGLTEYDRKAIFDLNCVSSSGEHFIVELQKAKQKFFKDRSVFYASFPIQRQAQRGDWDYRQQAVYSIGILDFVFDDEDPVTRGDVLHRVQLKDQRNRVFYDKLSFIYLTLPNFNKTEDELESEQDKWFFVFKNLHRLQDLPARLQGRIFERIFREAQIAKLDRKEQEAYEDSLKVYRDLKNVLDTARDEAFEEGKAEGLAEGERRRSLEIARSMKAQGLGVGLIAQLTGLGTQDIENL